VIVLAVCVAVPPAALAHAILVRSNPAAHATVKGDSLAIELKYNSRVDGARSKLTLDGPDGKEVALPKPTQPAPDTIDCLATRLAAGGYVLHWVVLASDGHISRGEIPFTVR